MQEVCDLPKTARQIEGSKDWIDVDGTVYTFVSNYKGVNTGKCVKKTQHPCYGYMYCGIYDTKLKKCVQKRVHKLVAKAYIPNPDNLPIVGHKNNIKDDNRVENLYWTTNQENIQKAVNDGLLVNDIGIDDSQSKPVVMFSTTTNEKLAEFGSICEAVRETGLSKTTIARQAKYHRPVRKPYYFRYVDDETAVANNIIGMFDYDTDKLLMTFYNTGEAARATNSNPKTVSRQCNKGKPKCKYSQCYFGYVHGYKM